MSDRTPFSIPEFEGKLEVVTEGPQTPPRPASESCKVELSPNYHVDGFTISRFTVTEFNPDLAIIEGTIEGENISLGKPITIWWEGKKQGEGEDETRKISPKYPIVFVDDKAELTLSREFNNISKVLALLSWFTLEDRFQTPSLSEIRRAILNLRIIVRN